LGAVSADLHDIKMPTVLREVSAAERIPRIQRFTPYLRGGVGTEKYIQGKKSMYHHDHNRQIVCFGERLSEQFVRGL
jgi:hypothetical protein